MQYNLLKTPSFAQMELEIMPERSSAVNFKLRMVFLKSKGRAGAHFRCLVPIHGKGWIGYDGMGFKVPVHEASLCFLSSNKPTPCAYSALTLLAIQNPFGLVIP